VFNSVLHAGGVAIPSDLAARLFFLGQGIGMLSLVPGGLGSADAFWLTQLDSLAGWSAAPLLAYRVIYYLLPWSVATLFLLRRAIDAKTRWAGPARMFASSLVLVSGSVILVSSATPALALRMRILQELLPLSVLEFSHLASALIGLLLFLPARGLMKGYRDAYRSTTLLLLAGAAGSMLKGLDYEEAIILTLTALLLWAHSNLFTLPSRQGRTAVAILVPLCVAIIAFTAVGLSAYHGRGFVGFHWLTFSHSAYAARFVRTLGVLILCGLLITI
jgi:phosphatidylglycerol lysyltransferase